MRATAFSGGKGQVLPCAAVIRTSSVLDRALVFAGGESAEKSRGLFLVRAFTT
jgi:hypothetical protein